jgi:hypothetical protein
MKMIGFMVCVAAVTLIPTVTQAQAVVVQEPGWIQRHWVESPPPLKYTSKELSFDMFGSYLNRENHLGNLFDTNIRHGTWGGGVGINYFFTRYLGVGALMNIPNNGGRFVDQAGGNLIFRLPLANSGLAPYIFGGGGRGFDPIGYFYGDGGVGLEMRLSAVTGIFVDGQYIWGEKGTGDKALFRAGLRFVF